jgi:hypothetical protein
MNQAKAVAPKARRGGGGLLPSQVHVTIELPDDQRAADFERYLKSGSGRAFAKRHFG